MLFEQDRGVCSAGFQEKRDCGDGEHFPRQNCLLWLNSMHLQALSLNTDISSRVTFPISSLISAILLPPPLVSLDSSKGRCIEVCWPSSREGGGWQVNGVGRQQTLKNQYFGELVERSDSKIGPENTSTLA